MMPGARDHGPRAARASPCRRRSGGSSDRGSACGRAIALSPSALANTSSSVGTLGRRCRTWTPCRAASAKMRAGRCASPSRAERVGHEHAHHVLVGRRGIPCRPARSTSTNAGRSPLTRSSNTRPPGPFSCVDRPLRRDLPLVHHDDVVAGVLDVGQQVRRQDQVDVLVVAEIADELEHLVAPLRIHAVGRLVEEQQIGIVHERLRQLDALLHAGRVGLDVAVARLAEADVVEHLVRALHRVDGRAGRRARRSRRRTTPRSCRECARRSPACSRCARGSRAAAARRRGRAPSSGPRSGLTNPSSALSIVLLPAPFGPSRPTAPRANRARDVLERAILAVDDGDAVEADDGPGAAGSRSAGSLSATRC